MAIVNGRNESDYGLHAIVAVWLNASWRSRVGVGMNLSEQVVFSAVVKGLVKSFT